MKKHTKKTKYEGGELDKRIDKMVGAREGTPIDRQMDKAMEQSHYKNIGKLAKAMAKTFQPKNLYRPLS